MEKQERIQKQRKKDLASPKQLKPATPVLAEAVIQRIGNAAACEVLLGKEDRKPMAPMEPLIQRMSLYHGTTIEDAAKIEKGIDPSVGHGEYGAGFYTVFDEDQAKHIAIYYWNEEEKWNDGKSGVATVETEIEDQDWDDLVNGRVKDHGVTHHKNYSWARTQEIGGGNSITLPQATDTEKSYRNGDSRNDPLESSVVIGPIKDKQTPYLQVVFDDSAAMWLNQNSTRSTIWKKKAEDRIDLGDEAENALGGLGSLVESEEEEIEVFKTEVVKAAGGNERFQVVYRRWKQDDDVPTEVILWLKERLAVTVEDEDEEELASKVMNSFYDNGLK